MIKHEYTDANLAEGLPADFMCGCAKGDLLGPCEHAQAEADDRGHSAQPVDLERAYR